MNIYEWSKLDDKTKRKILRRAERDITQQMEVAWEIINEVKEKGDQALCYYTEKFDQAKLSSTSLKVTEEEIKDGYRRVSPEFRETLEFAAANIRKFHLRQMPQPFGL